MAEISWTPLDLPAFNQVRNSTQTYLLPREKWPKWAQLSTQMQRLWIYCPPSGIASTATTAAVVGRMLTERFDRKDYPRPFNYNYHLLAESTAGAFQSGPLRTTDPPHHSSEPAPALDAYGPPPS
ncbi:MAG: hypothetical protein DMD38_15815 [Gemmatimonadetes bacterium]|nr:MAG: hypothetical protein DMD38_15815 [Gemmatimonadota bacterium]